MRAPGGLMAASRGRPGLGIYSGCSSSSTGIYERTTRTFVTPVGIERQRRGASPVFTQLAGDGTVALPVVSVKEKGVFHADTTGQGRFCRGSQVCGRTSLG